MHVTPSPVYPRLQVQVKPPGVLVQAALVSQLLSSGKAHSLKSEKQNYSGTIADNLLQILRDFIVELL